MGEHTWLPFRGLVFWVYPESSAGNPGPSKYGKQHWCVWHSILEKRISPLDTEEGTKLVPSWAENIDLRLSANWQGVPECLTSP